MKIKYISPNYKEENVTDRYLYIDLMTNDVIIDETQKTDKTNYTIRSYILPLTEHKNYSKVIEEARELKGCFPYHVDFIPDIEKLSSGEQLDRALQEHCHNCGKQDTLYCQISCNYGAI